MYNINCYCISTITCYVLVKFDFPYKGEVLYLVLFSLSTHDAELSESIQESVTRSLWKLVD